MLLDGSYDQTIQNGEIGNRTSDEIARGPAIPFLKWPGGKRWFISRHKDLLPREMKGRYIEPFVGTGAVFFALGPRVALLGDSNDDLIATYCGVKSDWEAILASLKEHQAAHNRDHYMLRVMTTRRMGIAHYAAPTQTVAMSTP